MVAMLSGNRTRESQNMFAPNRIFLLSIAFILMLASAEIASACSCARPGLPCESFSDAKAIFVGKVVGAKEQKESFGEGGVKTIYDVGEIYFKVEESFIGAKTSRVVIHSGTGGGDCGYWFIRGQSYLVYAYGESANKLYTHICTRTRPLDKAEEDLAFLRNLPRKGTGARIFGTVAAAVKDADSEGWRTMQPLPGITVKIEGKRRTFDAMTDAAGNYEVAGLEPGKYKVYAVLPDYYHKSEEARREIEINDRGCAEQDFMAHNDSRISGRVMEPEGRRLPKVMVELIPVEASDKVSWTRTDNTYADEQGAFELSEVAPGRYLLGINIGRSPDAETPYARTFYPGVTDRSQATVIEIGLGQKFEDMDIQLPMKLVERTVSGQVVWPDGSPAVKVDINLEDINHPGWCVNGCEVETDNNGRFTLRGFEGYTYKLQALSDAPQKLYSDGPVINLVGDQTGIKVILSIPGRPWDKADEERKKKSATPDK
jgi:Tissue inhibitor of metalloproteinase.